MAYILKTDEETAKLFSDKTRLKILELLSEKELTELAVLWEKLNLGTVELVCENKIKLPGYSLPEEIFCKKNKMLGDRL